MESTVVNRIDELFETNSRYTAQERLDDGWILLAVYVKPTDSAHPERGSDAWYSLGRGVRNFNR
jgi:hypothetical protein